MENFDVYAYGVISSSTLHLLSQAFPAPDAYAEIVQTHAMTGGEALNSSIVLSRLGISVMLDGNWLGDTPEGARLLETIRGYGIDARRLTVQPGYSGVREIVISDDHTRTVFGNYLDLLFTTRKWNIPQKADLARARLVCVDPPFQAESDLAGRYAQELGIPFVSIDCEYDRPLATDAAAVIISGEFRDREHPAADLLDLFDEYQQRASGLVVFTVGSKEVLYGRKDQPVQRFQPYRVKAIDTAGAGDSFRSGLMYGILQGWSDAESIRFASAVAAMVCASFPGVLNSPNLAEVTAFLRERDGQG
jgi:sugar/nucleoside kinase (ribokinase family)